MIPELAAGIGVTALLAYLAETNGAQDTNTNMTQPNSFTAMSKARDYAQDNFLDRTQAHELLLNNPEQFNKDYYILNRDAYMDNAMHGFYEWAVNDPNYPYKPDIESLKTTGKLYRRLDYPDMKVPNDSDRKNKSVPSWATPFAPQPKSSRIRLNIDSHNPEQTYKDMLALNAYVDTIQRYGSEKQRKHLNTILNPSLFDLFDYPDVSVQNEIIDFFNQNKEAIGKYDRDTYKKLLSEDDYARFIEDEPKRYKILPVVSTEDNAKADSVNSAGTQKTVSKLPSKPETKPVTTHGKRMFNSRIK